MLKHIKFIDNHGSFCVNRPENTSYLYFPLASEAGLKSSVTPLLGGDSKINQDTFLLEPVSSENLHNNRSSRNFWIVKEGHIPYSVTGSSAQQEADRFTDRQEDSELTAGFMWQTLKRTSRELGFISTVTSFIPKSDNVEIMYVTVENQTDTVQKFTAYGAIPVYGRSADNIRDHRNVTSMLHRIETTEHGINVCPTMSFDERGHQPNHKIYYVNGCSGKGENPISYYPTVEDFIGEGGTYTHPRTVYEGYKGVPAHSMAAGKEAMGAFCFSSFTLAPGEKTDFILLSGIADSKEEIENIFEKYNTSDKVKNALEETRIYWKKQVNVDFHTQDPDFDSYMKWVSFQPFLRRLFGCSFLPHHDYGRGGRGWRDLWQDCLALLIMNPDGVRQMLIDNFGGVRLDGTNATIIGSTQGEFIADRNGIARVWMDHGVWPYLTTELYINQTGDLDILLEENTYFKDLLICRGEDRDTDWDISQGEKQKDAAGNVYSGTLLEHLLIQNLSSFYDVGEHNEIRLRGADWNDALDMAAQRGESVAFTTMYADNMDHIAGLLAAFEASGKKTVKIAKEMKQLLVSGADLYEDVAKKREVLMNYCETCRHTLSGEKVEISVAELAANLKEKADWMREHIRKTEWVQTAEGDGFFNGYYDNSGKAVEGDINGGVRMMLTSQVFTIMSKTATNEQVAQIVKSADKYLYDASVGGYRLNTDFHEVKMDLGRMFGFAYGHKENGAVFCHMATMFGNALYTRGFAKEAYKVFNTLFEHCNDVEKSRIYPGVPEYVDAKGRGVYHYLTGAASWLLVTVITQMFGVRGQMGDLAFVPQLLPEQFDANGEAGLSMIFADRNVKIVMKNAEKKAPADYKVSAITIDGAAYDFAGTPVIKRANIEALSKDAQHTIEVTLA